ncbi:MAG TPA: phasin family protein [Rhodocyclaceae bacterium]|nr:phasin family protein [Rhodocyclaceae bacterium]
MVKKLKLDATDNQFAKAVKESAQQIWLAGLGAFAKAQEGGNKVFETLLREGEAIQEKTRRVTEDKVAEMAAKATGTWDKLEHVFEDRVAVAMHSLGVPTRKDVDALAKRVKELAAQVEKLGAAADPNPAPKPARRSAKPKSESTAAANAE